MTIAGLALAGCGSDGTAGAGVNQEAAPNASPAASSPVPPAGPVILTCADAGQSPFRAAKVTVTPDGQDIRTKWEWTGEVPASGTFGLFVTLDGSKADDLHQLGFKAQDGRQIGFFDFDMSTAQQRNLSDSVTISQTGAEMTFVGSGAPFASGFEAKGAVSVEGADVMSCT